MGKNVRTALMGGRIAVDFTMLDVLGFLLLWTVISVITLGIGLFFWPYAVSKFVINSISIYDNANARVGRLRCNLSAGSQIGHILLWMVISVVTLGLAYPFYIFGVMRTALNRTDIV